MTVRLTSLLLLLLAAPSVAEPIDDAAALADRGEYQAAIEVLVDDDDEAAVLLRVRLLWTVGEYEDALRSARRAAESRRATHAARAEYGRLLFLSGEYEAAIDQLDEAVETDEPEPSARYWRALAFEAIGRRSRSALEMEDFIREYNRGQVTSVEHLTLVALASHALENYHDANAAFRDVLEQDPENIAARIHWARLFLEKYRPDEAQALLREVEAINPVHPDALGLLALTEFQTTYDLDAVRDYVERALAVNPLAPAALEMQANLAIDARDYPAALEALDLIAENFPNRLSTLSMRGAVHFLRGDDDAFAEVEERVLELNPRFGEFYYLVGEYASQNFRYADGLALQERAIEVDAGFSPAYAALAVGYSRVGDDGRALQFLRRAHEVDPFNVQAFHMVELWESTLNDYRYVDDDRVEGLRYRFHRDERDVLERYIPPVMQDAFERYVERYEDAPEMPLSIEVFREPETFGIRSVGVPYAMQHGICFGHVVTSRSPSDGDFNWRQVLEHELSHVFSLHASDNRVPRWFTEGLAEYDTIVGNIGWRREHDLAMIQALQRDELLSVEDLNRAFVSMARPEGILEAYFQSSLVVEFIAERYGYGALIEMLAAWGRGSQTAAVLEEVLEVSVEEFDAAFEASLRANYEGLLRVFEPAAWWYDDYEGYEAAYEASPTTARAVAELAWAEYYRGNVGAAAVRATEALGLDSREPYAMFLAGRLAWEAGDGGAARTLFDALIDNGHESPSAHSVLAAVAKESGDLRAAAHHLAAAAELAPTDVMILREAALVASLEDDRAREIELLVQVATLDQNDADANLRLAMYLLDTGELQRATFFAGRAIDIAPFRADVQATSGRIAHRAQNWEVAARDLALAVESSDNGRNELLGLLLDAYRALGREADAARVSRELIE